MKNKEKKKKIVELKFLASSVKTRIEDLEWMIAYGNDRPINEETELSDRRKAYDKLKYIRRDIADLQKEIIDAEA